MPSKPRPDLGSSRLAPQHKGTSKTKLERPDKRLRTDGRNTKLAQAGEAKKKQTRKEEIQSHKPKLYDFNFVYVGNLKSTITTSRLESFFGDCGPIKKTIIRCSRGQAVIAGLALPKEVLGPRDRQYASIEFINSQSARKALAYDGMVLDGCKLVVSVSAADLPEVQDIVQKRVTCMYEKQLGPMAPHNKPQRPLVSQPTEPFTDFRDPKQDRYNFLGVSFAKGIM